MMKIAPSILACDFAALGAEVAAMHNAGADLIHVDVMDGHFVPNISLGLPVVASLRKATDAVLDVHLMISDPLTYAPQFCDKGADIVVFHAESDSEPQAVIDAIRAKGKKCGISIKPKTPADVVFPYLDQLDMVLVMTVEPGFGGQKFMEDMCPKNSARGRKCFCRRQRAVRQARLRRGRARFARRSTAQLISYPKYAQSSPTALSSTTVRACSPSHALASVPSPQRRANSSSSISVSSCRSRAG